MTAKNKTTKFISALIIISILMPIVLFSAPKKANAVLGVGDLVYDAANTATNWMTTAFSGLTSSSTLVNTGISVKNVAIAVGKELLRAAAKQVLAKMVQATVNWINSDFHGAPLFLENPQSFFRDIAKSELKTIVNIFGYDALLYPFGKDFVLNAINSYKSQLAINAQYTLSNVMNSAEYRGNFNYGGWNAFLINTQYPQNNYIGFNLLATEELAARLQGTVQNAAQQVQNVLQQGMGFLSPEICDPNVNPSYNNGTNEFQKPSFQYNVKYPTVQYNADGSVNLAADKAVMDKWNADKAAAQVGWTKTNTCLKPDGTSGLIKTTPGAVAANQVMTALDSPLKSLELDAALGNSLAAIFDALISHFLDKGLNSLMDTVNPEAPIDNWSYDGTTLDGNTSVAGDLNIPQNVSMTVGQTTSTSIFGGTENYSIQPQSETSKKIAIATIDVSGSAGPKLKITAGSITGTTTVIVQDSSKPAQIVTVTITVSAIGALVVSPANILTDANTDHQIIAKISGGNGDYSKQTSPNESVTIAIISGTNLIVTGIAKGNTFIDIKDSSTPIKTVRVNITVNGPDDLVINPQNISVKTGEVFSVPISTGTAPYIVTNQQNIGVAVAEILPTTPTTLTITGFTPGSTAVIIRDSSSPFKSTTVIVTTLDQQGSCIGGNLKSNQQTDQATCANVGGQWTPNP